MKTLLDAIKAKFDATGALTTAFPGGLHLVHATAGETRPFVVYRVVASPVTPAYGDGLSYGDYLVDFIGCAGSGANLIGLATLVGHVETLATTYRGGVTLTGLTNAVQIADAIPFPVPAEDERAGEVWQCAVQFMFSVDP